MICGSTAIQIGTVNFINPNAGVEIIEGIEKYCEKQSLSGVSEIIASYKL